MSYDRYSEKTTGVFLCSPTNSTLFTKCCQVAVCDDQERCPGCGAKVIPEDAHGRWRSAFGPQRKRQKLEGEPDHA